MKKTYFLTIFLVAILFSSCKKDDGGPNGIDAPLADRTTEAGIAEDDIVEFLETHFYNYEEFETPPAGFDFRIRIDTIAGDNATKIPLIEQVEVKQVPDRVEDDLEYNLYYLNVIQGAGERIHHPDMVSISYAGYNVEDNEVFDSSVSPVQFDLTDVIDGFQDGLVEFNVSTGYEVNPDGTLNFQNYGVGAVFIPSGLGYFEAQPRDINNNQLLSSYSQLYFTFQVYLTEETDQDNDTVPSRVEDVNGNGIEEDDDTDNDGFANYFDVDDDGDGILTRLEVVVEADGTITYPDTDNDGIPDYLDPDN